MNKSGAAIGVGVIVVALLLLLGCGALFATGLGMHTMMGDGYWFRGLRLSGALHPAGLLVVSLVWAVVIAIVVGLVALLLGRLRPATSTAGTTAPAATPPASVDTPLGILQMRYARGEITKEQYDAIRKDIT